MPERAPYEYVVIRVIPRVDRGEFINAGVVMICRPKRFLRGRVMLDSQRLLAIDPSLTETNLLEIERQLKTVCLVADGDPAGGPLAGLSLGERWHLLSAPASTVVQPSPVHTGLCIDPARELDELFAGLVDIARPESE
ncbi:MAG: DUF3037 domain-containing protein [Thermomicrobiales bacterium]|nr:DUF3037 domain-containing protein [Thermomicrobiales bacterium]